MSYRAIVIGASAGGLQAIRFIANALPAEFRIPIIIVQHLSPSSDNYWVSLLHRESALVVTEADEKEKIEPGSMYISPANYHLLVERDETLSLIVGDKVNFARPAIDLLFESAADVYKDKLIGVVMTGSSSDGALGLKAIKEHGGLTIVQNPDTAEYSFMPAAAIAATQVDHILPLEEIVRLLITIDQQNTTNRKNLFF